MTCCQVLVSLDILVRSMQEKMCVLNLNCHRYTTEYMIKSQKQAKSRELLKLSNDLIKRARIVSRYIHGMVFI